MTQTEAILDYLSTGAELTPLEDLDRFGTFRLAARVHELRRDGVVILERTITNDNGKRYASYRLWISYG